jgi:uncharacterized cupin superfamily protein
VSNLYSEPLEERSDGLLRARLGAAAGAERLGASLFEIPPGKSMHFHYHANREELLVVLRGTLALRTQDGWRDLAEGSVVAFAAGERGAHGYENRTAEPVRALMVSEQTMPNVTVYPDTNELGVFDGGRIGRLFDLDSA